LSETRLGEGDVSRAASLDATGFSRSPKPCSVEKTSLHISVCTLIRSNDATLMEPPARTDCVGMSSSCQLRSKPVPERRKLPASTKRTSNFLPMASGSSCCAGTAISELEGRTTSEVIRARRAAMASASA